MLTIVHPACLEDPAPDAGRWLCADDDPDARARAAASFGEQRRLLAPAEFQARARGQRDALVAWVDGNLDGAPAERWLTTGLSRDPAVGGFVLHAMCLPLVAEALGAGETLVVVTASPGMADALAELARRRRSAFHVRGSGRFAAARLTGALRAWAGFLRRVAVMASRFVLARAVMGTPQRQRAAEVEVLVESFVLDADLAADGEFHERYFPGLLPFYGSRGVRAGVLPHPYAVPVRRLWSLFRRMAACGVPFLPYELFLRWGDLARAVAGCMGAALSDEPLSQSDFAGVDLGALARAQRLRAALGALEPLLLLRVPARLAQHGVRPRLFVDWWEGQRIDLAMAAGFSGGSVRHVAVRQYPPLPGYLSLFATAAQARAGLVPADQWVCGTAAAAAFARLQAQGRMAVVPALRYAHLWREQGERDERLLVVPLPQSRPEQEAILACLLPALPALAGAFESVVVKAHPSEDPQRLRARLGGTPAELSDEPLPDLLRRARLVVTGFTSAAAEALCLGVPLLVSGRRAGLDMNPVEAMDMPLWQIVYDSADLEGAVRHWLPRLPPAAERAAMGRALRERWFQPVNEQTLLAFLP